VNLVLLTLELTLTAILLCCAEICIDSILLNRQTKINLLLVILVVASCLLTTASVSCKFTLMCASELNPMPTKEMVTQYNELRQDIVLLYELKLALANCQYELQTLRHRYETLAADRVSVGFYKFRILFNSVLFSKSLAQ